MTFKSMHISVSINRPTNQVYEFASNPENLPRWASGLGGSIKNVDDTLPSGVIFYNPMRVFPNNDGSELIFTLYRQPDMSDRMFADDAETVIRDLEKLKILLEKSQKY